MLQIATLAGMTQQQVRKDEARCKVRLCNATGDAPTNWGAAH
jgi:hypothetical protein